METDDGTFPNLDAVSCTQLTFGADIKLSASQVGAIRDSVLAEFPAASIPPWYFGEVYRWNDTSYEVAASISASNRTDPKKAYSAFFRVQRLGDRAIDGPMVRGLFRILESQENMLIYCTASFVKGSGDGAPYGELASELYQDKHGKLVMESYSAGIYDNSNGRMASVEVRRFNDESLFYSVSFYREGQLTRDFTNAILDQAVTLFKRVHRDNEEEADAEH